MAEAIDLYYWPTPNGWKVTTFLAEVELPHNVIPGEITLGDQFEPGFAEYQPEQQDAGDRKPRRFGRSPVSVFESGAILTYLSEKQAKPCRVTQGRSTRSCSG